MTRTRGMNGRILEHGLGRGTSSTLAGEKDHTGGSASAAQLIDFLGGSYDTLVKYEHHVVQHLWFSEVSK